MNKFLQLGDCAELEHWSAKYIKENCSFKAINTAGDIIGIILNGIIHKHPEPEEAPMECEHKKFRKILNMFDYIESKFNMFDVHSNQDRALDAKIMSVNDAYRGTGICKALTIRTEQYMLEHGIQLFHVMCTSFFSAKVCERMGFNVIYTLPFKDYIVDGVNPLLPAEPHDAVRCYTKIV